MKGFDFVHMGRLNIGEMFYFCQIRGFWITSTHDKLSAYFTCCREKLHNFGKTCACTRCCLEVSGILNLTSIKTHNCNYLFSSFHFHGIVFALDTDLLQTPLRHGPPRSEKQTNWNTLFEILGNVTLSITGKQERTFYMRKPRFPHS